MSRCLSIAVLAVVVFGCQSAQEQAEPFVISAGSPGPFEVRVGADGSLLAGSSAKEQRSPEWLVERVRVLTVEERHTSAQLLIERYPEVALRALRQADDLATLAVVAEAYREGGGWLMWVESHPDDFAEYNAERSRVWEALRSGRFADAAAIDLRPQTAAGPLAVVEASELRGTALLLADRPADAATAFVIAADAALGGPPHQDAKLRLLAVEAKRRSGRTDLASSDWLHVHASLSRAAWTPETLELLLSTRPAGSDWPIGGAFATEAAVSLEIAHRYLDRDEPRSALAAASRATELAASAQTHGRLRLAQAEALAQLGQSTAATTILMSLTSAESSAIAAEATAKLGTFELQRGRPSAGVRLLRRSLDSEDLRADARAAAEADLALALLATGRQDQGLAALRAAQQRFASSGDVEQLLQSLENEQRFHLASKRDRDADEVAERLRKLETAGIEPRAIVP